MKRALLAAVGLAAMVAAGLSLFGVPAGFPDGYISPYDKATLIWVTVGTYALLLSGIFTLLAALMQQLSRASVGAVFSIVLGASLWLTDACPRLEWCSATVQQFTGTMLDDGQGG